MKSRYLLPLIVASAIPASFAEEPTDSIATTAEEPTDSIAFATEDAAASILGTASTDEDPYGPLTEADYEAIASELGVDVPAIHAVIEIEAGKNHKGFWAPGKPLINFDLSMFRRMVQKHKINLGKYTKSHSVVFNKPDSRKYGSQQAAQQARLDAARTIDDTAAIEGTFWGMFQIGGFNWKKCGATSPDNFVELMSRSERDQLELFANFIRNTGLLEPLRKHNWRAFARGYNGSSYAARGYHTKLANAYKKYS